MRTMTEQEAREQFGAALEASQSGPVLVRRGGEDVGVLISTKDFEEFRKLRVKRFLDLCDQMAEEAARRGMTDEILDDLLRDAS
ncbi:MAG: hypothetical protein RLY86_3955 [Pseudomonadota bacterium]